MPRRNAPKGSAGARVNISLPVSLVARVRRFPDMNLSAICADALTTAVEAQEVEAAWQEFVALATGPR